MLLTATGVESLEHLDPGVSLLPTGDPCRKQLPCRLLVTAGSQHCHGLQLVEVLAPAQLLGRHAAVGVGRHPVPLKGLLDGPPGPIGLGPDFEYPGPLLLLLQPADPQDLLEPEPVPLHDATATTASAGTPTMLASAAQDCPGSATSSMP